MRLSNIKKNDFVKNAITLVTGTGIAQIIPLLVAPIVARLYAPADYAVLAAYSSVTVLLTIIATGMYDAALMLDKTDKEAANTGAVAFSITIVITIIALLVMIVFRSSIAELTGIESVEFWLFLVPFTVFCSGFYQTLNVWNNRKQRYKRLASNRIIMTLITSSLTLSFGFLHFKEKGLLISLLCGQAISLLILLTQTFRNDKILILSITKSEILRSLRRHKDFPIYNMPQGFLDGVKESSTIWIISNFFGANVLGAFSFAKSILMRPLQIVGNAVSQVFYQKASSIYNTKGSIYEFSKKTFLILFAIGLPFAIIIIFLGKDLFTIVFSKRWTDAGIFSQILIPWLLFSFVGSAISSIPLILRKQKQYFYWAIVMNFLPIIVLYIFGNLEYNIFQSLNAFVMSSIIIYLLVFSWIRFILLNNYKGVSS